VLVRIVLLSLLGSSVLGAGVRESLGADRPTVAAHRSAGGADTVPDATMLRFPDVSATHIVFLYATDLWLVPREGGLASPLAGPPGLESFPRFSDDGETIAFVGNYDGNRDLYTLPRSGGVPHRVTHHPAGELLCGWTSDNRLLFSTGTLVGTGLGRQRQLATVPATGGMPEKLPVPYGVFGEISPDGRLLAYTPETRDFATWKRYRGGLASDIWVFDLEEHTSRRLTDWEGTDSQPMWHGEDLYYMSDAGPAHRLNIWRWDADRDEHEQITHFTEYDVKWPSMGPGPDGQGEIVFQNGPELFLLDLATRRSHAVQVRVPGDRPKIRPRHEDASRLISGLDISATGKRGVFEARGDLWTVPATKGPARNLSRTSGVFERSPAWSPDGKWIAYFADTTGEYELYITRSDGRGETRKLTNASSTFYFSPSWSPDSKHIVYFDKAGTLHLHTLEPDRTREIATDPYANRHSVSFSHDSHWLAYTQTGDNQLRAIWLYNLETEQKHQVTSGRFNDTWPTFDRKGDYLFFASNRQFTSPTYADVQRSFVYVDTDRLLVVPLREDLDSPWAPRSDEEEWKEDQEPEKDADQEADEQNGGEDDAEEDAADDETEETTGDETKPDAEQPDEDQGLQIDLDHFERRALALPVKRGSFSHLAVNDKGQLLYVRRSRHGGGASIRLFDLKDEKKKEKTVMAGPGWFAISADGKKLLVRHNGRFGIVKAAAGQKIKDAMQVSGLDVTIDPRAEWRQLFLDAWRLERGFFYDPNMHGVNWPAVRDRYLRMLEHCVCREDVSYVIGEMISELNVGHAYVWGQGDVEGQPHLSVGMLGCDFELHEGAYRIARIIEAGPWDVDGRGPLSRPNVDVKEGDYLLAVNGAPLDTAQDPWAAFIGLAGETVTLTVSEKPTLDDDARRVLVDTMGGDGHLRYRAWVEEKRAYVDDKTGGKVGYIYVPDTGVHGQNELFRQFFGQTDKKALIIDDRWNGGGQIPDRFIELLNRPVLNYWANRHGESTTAPGTGHFGPKCMLINGASGSGGDAFPYYFRKTGLGKLIGIRTWGGLVGISGSPRLIDGGHVTVPAFAFYETDGTWGVEGHGVDPDIEVIDDPAEMTDGGDPQLDAAVRLMLSEIQRHPYRPVPRPAYPDRSGMGMREEDR